MKTTRAITQLVAALAMAVPLGLVGCSEESSPAPSRQSSTSQSKQVSSGNPRAPAVDVKTIAEAVSRDIGTVSRSGTGSRGAPILVLEETHTSRPGQLEQAIALVRLHEQFDLRDIALEGYLKERPAITTEWFARAGRGLTPTERAAVSAQMLRDAEISAAEFMKLTYDDIVLHPIETLAEHAVELKGEAASISLTYLLKIAQTSLRESHVPRLQQLQREVESASGTSKAEKVKEMLDYILSVDPWTKAKGAAFADTNRLTSTTAEKLVAEVEEIEQRARKVGAALDEKDKRAMEENLRFWRGRAAASRTMIAETGRIADRPGVRLVALNIGAAHTDGMAAMLDREKRPYAVIRPLALSGGMSTSLAEMGALERKYKGLSIFNEGITKELLDAFPVRTQKKPEPGLNQPWFQAKSEMNLFTSRIVRRVIPAPGSSGAPPNTPRPPSGSPPFGFGDDDLRGKWIYIDPKRISAVPNENAVLFPVVLSSADPSRQKELWVKAGFSPAFTVPVTSDERKAVEEMLRKHLDDVRLEDKAAQEGERKSDPEGRKEEMPRKAEDAKGRIQIDKDVVAAIKTSQADAARASIAAI